MTRSSSHLNPKIPKPKIPKPKIPKLTTPEINLVATSQLSPERFVKSNQLEFISSSDDVGSLVFSAFSLPSGNSISLIHYTIEKLKTKE